MKAPRIDFSTAPLRRWTTPALAVVVGLGLLYVAVPRSVAAFLKLGGTDVLLKIEKGEESVGDPRPVIDSRLAALGWADDSESWFELATGQLVAADLLNAAEAPDRSAAQKVIDSLTSGLARNPVNPQAWSQLAYVLTLLNGPSYQAAQCLTMSIYTGPQDRRLIFVRLNLLFVNWDELDAEMIELAHDQIRFAWTLHYGYYGSPKARLIDLGTTPRRLEIIREALAELPDEVERFDRLFIEYRRDLRRRESREQEQEQEEG